MSKSTSGNFSLVHWEKTDLDAEKQTQLDISEGKQVMFSLVLDELQVGDIVRAYGALRCTNNAGGNIAFGCQIILADSQTQTEPSTDDDCITYFRGENVTPDVHHGIRDMSGSTLIVAATVNRSYVNFIARAQTDMSGDPHLRIDRGYGEMQYEIFRDLT